MNEPCTTGDISLSDLKVNMAGEKILAKFVSYPLRQIEACLKALYRATASRSLHVGLASESETR